MVKDEQCVKVCHKDIPANDAIFINKAIEDRYLVHWVVDGLPAARYKRNDKDSFSSIGFPLGWTTKTNEKYFNNHFDIYVNFHTDDQMKYRVVGVQVAAKSIKSDKETNDCMLGTSSPFQLSTTDSNKVAFTYSVTWIASANQWGTRWDPYLEDSDAKIHWFSVVNSAAVALLLSGMVSVILVRNLRHDIARYNDEEAKDEVQEEFGWKIVHADVFRPPSYRMLLSVIVGNGMQLLLMATVTIVFAALGFLSPSNRGSLSTVMIVFYVLFGPVTGYTSSRIYKLLGGESWRQNVLLAAFLIPGLIFGVFLILNFFLIGAKSSGAVPFGTMFALIALWFLVSVPLCFAGAYFGFKKAKIEVPVRTNQIPRQIPEQPLHLQFLPTVLVAGLLPFGAVFIELYFIMNSIWSSRIYYVFGFLFLVFTILVITCSLVSILACYFQLCAENYNWWWRAFLCSATSGLYMFLYGVSYFYSRLDVNGPASAFLFFGWTLAMSFMFSVLTGSIGFLATLKFVLKIYGAIKVD